MFKWLRDMRYNDVLAQMKQIDAKMEAFEIRFDTITRRMNSLQGYFNRKKLDVGDSGNEDDLEIIKREFGGQLPIELQHLNKG